MTLLSLLSNSEEKTFDKPVIIASSEIEKDKRGMDCGKRTHHLKRGLFILGKNIF